MPSPTSTKRPLDSRQTPTVRARPVRDTKTPDSGRQLAASRSDQDRAPTPVPLDGAEAVREGKPAEEVVRASSTRQQYDRHDEPRPFISTPRAADELAEELGESFLQSATSGEDAGAERAYRTTEAERGGPYVLSNETTELGLDVDDSNPEDATREPFPRS